MRCLHLTYGKMLSRQLNIFLPRVQCIGQGWRCGLNALNTPLLNRVGYFKPQNWLRSFREKVMKRRMKKTQLDLGVLQHLAMDWKGNGMESQ